MLVEAVAVQDDAQFMNAMDGEATYANMSI